MCSSPTTTHQSHSTPHTQHTHTHSLALDCACARVRSLVSGQGVTCEHPRKSVPSWQPPPTTSSFPIHQSPKPNPAHPPTLHSTHSCLDSLFHHHPSQHIMNSRQAAHSETRCPITFKREGCWAARTSRERKRTMPARARTHTTTSYSVPVCCQGGRSKNGTNQNGSGESDRRREDGGLHLLGSSESSSTQKCHRYSSPRPRLHHRRRHSTEFWPRSLSNRTVLFHPLNLEP